MPRYLLTVGVSGAEKLCREQAFTSLVIIFSLV